MKAKETFLRFWKSENSTISLIRDVFVALLAVLIVLLILWTYTGQWFGAPMVAIESGSMEHPENAPFAICSSPVCCVSLFWDNSRFIIQVAGLFGRPTYSN